MIALCSGSLAASNTTEAPSLAPQVPRMLAKGSSQYERFGENNAKCCYNGKAPAHNWVAGVNTKLDCMKRCNDSDVCTGFTFSHRGCLIWKGPMTPNETLKAPGYAGCWHKKSVCNSVCAASKHNQVAFPGDNCFFCNCAGNRGYKTRVAAGKHWNNGQKNGQCGVRRTTTVKPRPTTRPRPVRPTKPANCTRDRNSPKWRCAGVPCTNKSQCYPPMNCMNLWIFGQKCC